ncbi:MAG: peptidoglycan-binding domain-containing protein [Kiloniellales bacterium]|nr:peptidoglycan-binding domain-containing protein [Kiloniellales bacterium]
MPHPSDRRRQDFDFAGYRDRPVQSETDPTVKRFVWRVVIESAVILGLLVGVVFLTYQAGYLLLFKGSEEPSSALTDPQGTAPPGTAQGGSLGTGPAAATVSHYMIQLSPALTIQQADQMQARLEATYANLLGSLKVSLRAQQAQGGAPVYYVVAGPLFSPVTADDLCGQIEDAGYGDPCSVLPQTAAPAGVAAAPAQPLRPAQPVATGASPEIIAMVQRRLREAGFRPGGVSGQIGPETTDAIRAYQISAGLEPTGQITSDLLDRLAAAPAASQPAGQVSSSVSLPLDAATTPALQGQPAGVTGGLGAAGAVTAPLPRSSNPLTARAQEFLQMGDFSSARLLYEQAFNQGDAAAAAGMALTFDPVYYQEAGVVGMTPNPESAVAWYRRAIDAGDASAVPRLEKLIKWLQQRSASNEEARRVLQRLQ